MPISKKQENLREARRPLIEKATALLLVADGVTAQVAAAKPQ